MTDGMSEVFKEIEPETLKVNKHVSVVLEGSLITLLNSKALPQGITLKRNTLKKVIRILKKNHFLLLLLILSSSLRATDIVQIDIGNAITYEGQLNIFANPNTPLETHGTYMVKALYAQAVKQGGLPITAKQIVFILNDDISYLKAYATALKEKPAVVTISLAGLVPTIEEYQSVLRLVIGDALILAAAGNQGSSVAMYPASYRHPCVVSVGTLRNGGLARYSNQASTYLEEDLGDLPGTSSSTARMGAVALRLRRQYPYFTCAKIANMLRGIYGKR